MPLTKSRPPKTTKIPQGSRRSDKAGRVHGFFGKIYTPAETLVYPRSLGHITRNTGGTGAKVEANLTNRVAVAALAK
jgi:hypothetical protein